MTRTDKKTTIVLGSRESALAMAQTRLAADLIEAAHPQVRIEILPIRTTGDRILDRPLEAIGGKGLFVKELDRALLDGRTDFSVHSLKDVPMETDSQLPLLAYLKREDPRDVLVLPEGVSEIDFSKPFGTGSGRRILQLEKLYPQAEFAPLRGNILTRIRKLDEGEYGAIVLAAAGLKRMGLEHRISRFFTPDEVIPAAGQGILAVQGSADADRSLLDGVRNEESERAAACERAFVRTAGGDCSAPTAAYAQIDGSQIFLRALYHDSVTGIWMTGSASGRGTDPAECAMHGEILARQLKEACEALREKGEKPWI